MTPEIKQRIEQIRRGEVPEGYVKKRKVVIPQQWGLPQIKDIASISSGSTPNRNNSEYWNGNIAWVTTGELSSGHVNHTSELITVKAVKETKMRIYPQGTLLMAMYGQGKTRGTVAILEIDAAVRSYAANDTSNYSVAHYGDIIYTKSPTGDFLYGIVKQNLLQETVAVSPLYGVFTPLTFGLGYFLHTYFQSAICARNYLLPIVQKGAKNTINITNDTFISSKLYLPLDVEEQKAIADTFIAADREIELLQQDIEQEKQKKKALMQLLLTGIVRVKT